MSSEMRTDPNVQAGVTGRRLWLGGGQDGSVASPNGDPKWKRGSRPTKQVESKSPDGDIVVNQELRASQGSR